MDYQYIVSPIVGALIGLFTNSVALKMIFRPLTPKYIGKWQLPFTPGIIPRERKRLALTVGTAISDNLMNKESIEKTLLSQEMYDKIGATIDDFVAKQFRNNDSLQRFLYETLSEKEINEIVNSTKKDLAKLLHEKLSNPELGRYVSHIVVQHAIKKTQESILGLFGAENFIKVVATPAEELLSKNINQMLSNNSEEMVMKVIDNEAEKILATPMREIMTTHQNRVAQVKENVISAYKRIVSEHLPRILETINISRIVEDRINDMDVRELERITLQVVSKELKWIVWLGGMLGFIMGFINVFFR